MTSTQFRSIHVYWILTWTSNKNFSYKNFRHQRDRRTKQHSQLSTTKITTKSTNRRTKYSLRHNTRTHKRDIDFGMADSFFYFVIYLHSFRIWVLMYFRRTGIRMVVNCTSCAGCSTKCSQSTESHRYRHTMFMSTRIVVFDSCARLNCACFICRCCWFSLCLIWRGDVARRAVYVCGECAIERKGGDRERVIMSMWCVPIVQCGLDRAMLRCVRRIATHPCT